MKWKEFVADYLNFSRKDRIAIIAILGIVLAVFFLPEAFSKNSSLSNNSTPDTTWITALKTLEQKEAESSDENRQYPDDNSSNYQYDRRTGSYSGNSKEELFYFDPNTLSREGWLRLGLREKTVSTIQNYLSKGGQFKKPEDLQKIYGLFPDEFKRISPYIKIEIPGEVNTYKDFTEKVPVENPSAKTYTPRYSVIDINSADTTALIILPGIGSKLATRIINFRDKLGGFYSINQVAETYGVPDSTFQHIRQYLKLENIALRKININTATVDELKAHPYIRYSIANPIIAYRNEHGPFSKIEDLKKVMVVTEEVYKKIVHYINL
ncbi:MAG: helix-hairpin-helix domain-containing protein [Chitinophagaceae bacterium]|nr:helix-hairpin-helix domain-containing protein [Chitinophagaceae bacterium]